MDSDEVRSPTSNLQTYSKARHFLRIMDRVSYTLYRATFNAIWGQRGTPQDQVDWSDPDAWIAERLAGEEQALARRIWTESNHELNPRYLRPLRSFTEKHCLMTGYGQDTLRLTERGRQFLAEPEGAVTAEIDIYEGILTILRLVAECGPGKRSDFLPAYAAYCRTRTSSQSDSVIKSSLYHGLKNLVERGYIVRRAQTYEVTDDGLTYLDSYDHLIPGWSARAEQPEIAQVSGTAQSKLRRVSRDISRKE